MVKLQSGSVLAIPLLKGLGYAWAKYIDLTKVKKGLIFPDLIKVYAVRTKNDSPLPDLKTAGYLLNPMAVAGLPHLLKEGRWKIAGETSVDADDEIIPSFKGGNSTYEDIERGQWLLHKECEVNNPIKVPYEEVKYLQPLAAIAGQNIELRLTMYHVINEGLDINDFFNLNDDRDKWNYKQVVDSPAIVSR